MRTFLIYEQIEPTVVSNRFRIVEMYLTSDGYRTRLTNSAFTTLADAQQCVKEWYEELARSK
jgi:hypothetical protein